jgi:hypothetical protein
LLKGLPSFLLVVAMAFGLILILLLAAIVTSRGCVAAKFFATHWGLSIDRLTLILISTGTRPELFVTNWRLSVACVTWIPITTGMSRGSLAVGVLSILFVAFMARWTLKVIPAVVLWGLRTLPAGLGVTTIEDH